MSGEFRGQVVFRRCRGDHNAEGDVDVGIGVLEAHPATFPAFRNQDILIDLAWERSKSGMAARMIAGCRGVGNDHASSDVGFLLNSLQYPRGMDTAAGSLFVRATRLSQEYAKAIYLIAIVVEAEGSEIDRTLIHDVTGSDLKFSMAPGTRRLPFEPNGMALCQIHRSAVWGWDNELWGPVSTMRLDVLDACREYDDLQDIENPTATQLQRMEHLRPKTPYDLSHGRMQNDQFRQFRRAMIQAGHKSDWSGRLTESQERAREAAAADIIKTLMAA